MSKLREAAFRAVAPLFIVLLTGAATAGSRAQMATLTVRLDQPGVKISPMLYGLMTEEINHSYDGGLYAELIRNRTFQDDPDAPVNWSLVQQGAGSGEIALDASHPVNIQAAPQPESAALRTCLKLTISAASGNERVGVANEGWWGIPVRPGTRYRASFYARAEAGFHGPLNLDIESNDGATVYAHARVSGLTSEWHRYSATLTTSRSAPASAQNRFVLSASSPGVVYLNLVSLFPPTYHNRPNGNRPDLMRLLGDMKPAFLRLPGGNYLEGNSIPEHFDWKKTIGDLAQRPGHPCPWGYRSSDGLGLLEYLEWCEDLHMETVLAVFDGYALNGQNISAGEALKPVVQDALDEIEYAIGGADTTWGRRRAEDGHPPPFKVRFVEIGNEEGGPLYDARYAQFYAAIKAKYPDLQIISTAQGLRLQRPDVVDDHYYRSAREMERDVHHYDGFDRTGPKIFVGEWATIEGNPTPTLNAALGDAAWLTGLERNSDLVEIASYAPLFVNVNPGAAQWGTNLIGYDALRSYGSPSYYAQVMFGTNRGDIVLPVELPPPPVQAVVAGHGAVGVGTWATRAEFQDFQVADDSGVLYQASPTIDKAPWRTGTGAWTFDDGVVKQAADAIDCRAIVGDPKWTNYTYRLKARKISGAEGFLILFHVQDDRNFIWWNIGGWNNTRTAIERAVDGAKSQLSRAAPVSVETGRWYDIKIEVRGTEINCYLDGKLITHAVDTAPLPIGPIFSTASRDLASGDIILKVVNIAGVSQPLRIELRGAQQVATTATIETLSGQPGDFNRIESPARVAPKLAQIRRTGPRFEVEFAPYSVNVLRIKAK